MNISFTSEEIATRLSYCKEIIRAKRILPDNSPANPELNLEDILTEYTNWLNKLAIAKGVTEEAYNARTTVSRVTLSNQADYMLGEMVAQARAEFNKKLIVKLTAKKGS